MTDNVALYARAWVEILLLLLLSFGVYRRPLREGVGRNQAVAAGCGRWLCRPLREGVGRNPVGHICRDGDRSRPLREGVGRNIAVSV